MARRPSSYHNVTVGTISPEVRATEHHPYRSPGRRPPREPTSSELALPRRRNVAKICLKCAATQRVERRRETLAIGGATWLGIAGGIICNSVADRFRDQPDLLLPVAIFLVAHRHGKNVTVDLPLCPTCNTSWDAGLSLQRKAMLGVGTSAALVLAGVAMAETALAVAAALASVLIGLAVRTLPRRFVIALRKDASFVYLKGASPLAIARLDAWRRSKVVAPPAPRMHLGEARCRNPRG